MGTSAGRAEVLIWAQRIIDRVDEKLCLLVNQEMYDVNVMLLEC